MGGSLPAREQSSERQPMLTLDAEQHERSRGLNTSSDPDVATVAHGGTLAHGFGMKFTTLQTERSPRQPFTPY